MLRNIFAILRISFGVLILLVLISSGLGLNTFIKQANSYVDSNGNSSQTVVSTITDQVNLLLGTNLSNSMVGKSIESLINNIVYVVDGIASIVFLVGILDIINTMGFNLNERRREIGILKTLGFSHNQLFLSISLEAGLIGFLGSIGGVLLGSLGLLVLADIIGIPHLHINTVMANNWGNFDYNSLKYDFGAFSSLVCSQQRCSGGTGK